MKGKSGSFTGGPRPAVVLLAGPTASGKSALALRLADELDGTVVNADSMQVYDTLRILTARPSAADEAIVPHRLYGHVPVRNPYSVAAWLGHLEAVLKALAEQDRPAIVVGGTGLYFDACLNGLSAVPTIDPAIRRTLREMQDAPDLDLHAILTREDPAAASALRPTDRQRVVRALEVVRSTGRSLVTWQGERSQPLIGGDGVRRLLVMPDAFVTRERIERRANDMLNDPCLPDEVASVVEASTASHAIGLAAARSWIEGRSTRDETIQRITTASAQYAKRQRTWFRNRMRNWELVDPIVRNRW